MFIDNKIKNSRCYLSFLSRNDDFSIETKKQKNVETKKRLFSLPLHSESTQEDRI